MSSPLPQWEIRDPAADTEVRIVVGTRFIVRLTENPTTGNRWHYELAENGVLAYMGSDYLSKQASSGSDGYRSFYFIGSLLGSAHIKFILRGAGEASPALQMLQVLVAVAKV
jgi:predicted secreted protein